MADAHREPDLGETSRIETPSGGGGGDDAEKTSPLGRGGAGGSRPGEGAAPSDETSGGFLLTKTKGGTNVDTILGRVIVDHGLATPEEVQHCLEEVRALAPETSQMSLAELLVDKEYITRRQLARIRSIVEAERSGQQIPGYKILGKLGAGAMATVYKARQLSLDRTVAIKVLPRKFSSNPQFIERFYAEGRAAAQLNHPNIVQAYDVGQAGEYHYFVMEYVEGRTVYDDIIKHKKFGEVDAIDVVMQIAEALEHAHAKGLIHRDVKPKNVMINREGVAKLADMGLARAMSDKEAAEAEQGKAFGTPYYISPEQIRGEREIGPAADIYSLGATLYHMVTGNVPFDGKNPSAVMHKHLKAELAPPDHVNPRLSAGISEVIEMMMAKNPRERYQNCRDLLGDLRLVRAGKHPVLAHRDMLGGVDLAAIAEAEKQAPAIMAVDQSAGGGSGVSMPLFVVMVVLLVLSVGVNILLSFRAFG